MSNDQKKPGNSSDPLEQLAQTFAEMQSMRSRDIMHHTQNYLASLCETVAQNRHIFDRVKKSLDEVFQDSDYVTETLSQGVSLCILSGVHSSISHLTSYFVDGYQKIGSRYSLHVKDRLKFDDLTSMSFVSDEGVELVKESANLFVNSRLTLPHHLEKIYTTISGYQKYLRDRFVKKEDEEKSVSIFQMLRTQNEQKELKGKYVKVKLIDNNPFLTDVLLEFSDNLPSIHRVKSKRNGQKKENITISNHGIEHSSRQLAALADSCSLSYLQNPSLFFNKIGRTIEELNETFKELDPHHKKLLDNEHAPIIISNIEEIKKNMTKGLRNNSRYAALIKETDFNTIVQDQDTIQPDNRREKEYFKLREDLFAKIMAGLSALAAIEDPLERINPAREYVLQAVELKDQMDQLKLSNRSRKLRRDKKSDNEYYEGAQGDIGEFYFERAPTPQVKIKDVIGTSFDKAKRHLDEIVSTGAFPRVMELSAPGRKVRSNVMLIGPYGCGKTELARGVCGDERVIGASVSVAGTLTAYMHESVNNVKRIYDKAMDLRRESLDEKPVVLVLDEFDSWFAKSDIGAHSDKDMRQIETIFLQILDGMGDYNGIITMAMTNKPRLIPPGILRRFRYVDIVGQLTQPERETVLKMFLEKSLPISEDIPEHYSRWAKKLVDAPGDVIRKVVDEIHFKMIPEFISKNESKASRIERVLSEREIREGRLSEKDITFVKEKLRKQGYIVTVSHVDDALDNLLKEPTIQMQINAARELYEDAQALLQEISAPSSGFGFKHQIGLFDIRR